MLAIFSEPPGQCKDTPETNPASPSTADKCSVTNQNKKMSSRKLLLVLWLFASLSLELAAWQLAIGATWTAGPALGSTVLVASWAMLGRVPYAGILVGILSVALGAATLAVRTSWHFAPALAMFLSVAASGGWCASFFRRGGWSIVEAGEPAPPASPLHRGWTLGECMLAVTLLATWCAIAAGNPNGSLPTAGLSALTVVLNAFVFVGILLGSASSVAVALGAALLCAELWQAGATLLTTAMLMLVASLVVLRVVGYRLCWVDTVARPGRRSIRV